MPTIEVEDEAPGVVVGAADHNVALKRLVELGQGGGRHEMEHGRDPGVGRGVLHRLRHRARLGEDRVELAADLLEAVAIAITGLPARSAACSAAVATAASSWWRPPRGRRPSPRPHWRRRRAWRRDRPTGHGPRRRRPRPCCDTRDPARTTCPTEARRDASPRPAGPVAPNTPISTAAVWHEVATSPALETADQRAVVRPSAIWRKMSRLGAASAHARSEPFECDGLIALSPPDRRAPAARVRPELGRLAAHLPCLHHVRRTDEGRTLWWRRRLSQQLPAANLHSSDSAAAGTPYRRDQETMEFAVSPPWPVRASHSVARWVSASLVPSTTATVSSLASSTSSRVPSGCFSRTVTVRPYPRSVQKAGSRVHASIQRTDRDRHAVLAFRWDGAVLELTRVARIGHRFRPDERHREHTPVAAGHIERRRSTEALPAAAAVRRGARLRHDIEHVRGKALTQLLRHRSNVRRSHIDLHSRHSASAR